MAVKQALTPEQRIKLTCDLSNTVLSVFLSSVKERFPHFTLEERKEYLKQLVKERERNRRI
ncbi:MAG: hypothetical protein ACFFDW_06360 [Candidatus Thorarchaeota archaeon]